MHSNPCQVYKLNHFVYQQQKHVITGNMVYSGPDLGDAAPASVPVEGDPAFGEEDPWGPATFQDSSRPAG